MKLSKRFSLLKKSLGLTLIASCILAYTSCNNLTSVPTPTMTATASKTLYAPSFPEQTDSNGNPIDGLTYSQRYYTVSQGLKRKITLSWNPVEIAKYYQIYAARNINDNFEKIGESKTANFEDSVGSGATFYYKVRAVNSQGETSDFSSIVHGTSLATPAINNIEIDDTSATVFWYMGNVGIDSYVKDLVYEVHAFKGNEEKVATIKAWDEASQSAVESYSFENLSGNTDYEFRIDAYLASEQSEVESSPKVSKKTLAQYTPVSPEFTATQGESINYVKLLITLPPMIQVQTKLTNESDKHDVDYPVCFEIQRKKTDESEYRTIVSTLYYDGTTTAPSDTTYKTDTTKYIEGKTIEYKDTVQANALSVARGTKYDYRIISYIDINYSSKMGYEFNSTIGSKAALANTSTGWAAARPDFRVKNFTRTIDPNDPSKVASVSLGFNATWTDLDKAPEYKFAIEQNRRTDPNDQTGTDSWITDTNGNIILKDLAAVSSVAKFYYPTSNPSEDQGIYRYSLYVFPAKCTDYDQIKTLPDLLDKVEAINIISVSSDATVAVAELKAEGGWSDHIHLTWTVETGVTYSMSCEQYDTTNATWRSYATITSEMLLKGNSTYDGVYDHIVEGGKKYRYVLQANTSTSDSVIASALGTPNTSFTANSYEDIKVSWPQVIEAVEYTVKLGTNGGFGNGASFSIARDGTASGVPDGLTVTSELEDSSKPDDTNILLTIKKPYGWNDATLSGKATPLTVTALSEFDAQNQRKGQTSATKDVWTIGPAATNLKATETYALNTNSVKISWSKLDGAVGYAVYRMRPEMTGIIKNDTVEKIESKVEVYYVNADGTSVTGGSSETVSINYNSNDKTFTLTDKFKKKTEGDNSKYGVDQQYLALGLPFTYTILPVLKIGDAKDIDSMAEWDIVAYSNLANVQKIGYTTGYGIALEASKADYNDSVLLTWELPQSAKDKGTTATICYRKKGSDDVWTTTNASPTSNTTSYIFKPSDIAETSYDDTIQALEYAIKYSGAMNKTNSPDIAYDEYLKDDKLNTNEKITTEERKNVGYMFTLPKITYDTITSDNEDYTETLKWYRYDHYTEDPSGKRAVGGDVDGYSLTLKNNNIASIDWPVFDYNKAGVETYRGSSKYTWYNLTESTPISGTIVTVKLTPKDINQTADTGTHNGLLKVQRDYEHHYTLTASRKNSSGETITTTRTATLYRKITKDEFAKGITLIIADSLYQAGITDGSGYAYCTNEQGQSIKYRHKGASKNVIWGTDGNLYTHQFKSGLPGDTSKTFTSGWTIKLATQEFGRAADGKKVYYLTTNGAKMKVYHKTGLTSYGGSSASNSEVEFTMGAQGHDGWTELSDGVTTSWTLSFKKDGVSICPSFSDAATFKTWFPLDIGGDYSSSVTTYTEGLPLYSGNWWLVKTK